MEQAVDASLGEAMDEARALLLARFAGVTLADLAREFGARHRAANCDDAKPAKKRTRRRAE